MKNSLYLPKKGDRYSIAKIIKIFSPLVTGFAREKKKAPSVQKAEHCA